MLIQTLTEAEFREKIFDYQKEETWVFKGNRPAIIDFYADWCAPCRMVAPILEELSLEYDGQVDFYKVNTEKERELASVFGIRSIPTFLFIPATGDPMLHPGAFPKKVFEQIIGEKLLTSQE